MVLCCLPASVEPNNLSKSFASLIHQNGSTFWVKSERFCLLMEESKGDDCRPRDRAKAILVEQLIGFRGVVPLLKTSATFGFLLCLWKFHEAAFSSVVSHSEFGGGLRVG